MAADGPNRACPGSFSTTPEHLNPALLLSSQLPLALNHRINRSSRLVLVKITTGPHTPPAASNTAVLIVRPNEVNTSLRTWAERCTATRRGSRFLGKSYTSNAGAGVNRRQRRDQPELKALAISRHVSLCFCRSHGKRPSFFAAINSCHFLEMLPLALCQRLSAYLSTTTSRRFGER
jgi:hypothetical protein